MVANTLDDAVGPLTVKRVRDNPAQGKKSTWGFQPLEVDYARKTPEEIARINLQHWLDEKRLRDATRTSREGFYGYKA